MMQLAYSSLREPPKMANLRRVDPDTERALKRLAIRETKDIEKAFAEYPEELKLIRKHNPDWMPERIVK